MGKKTPLINQLKCIISAEHRSSTTQSPFCAGAARPGGIEAALKNSGLGNICALRMNERCRGRGKEERS